MANARMFRRVFAQRLKREAPDGSIGFMKLREMYVETRFDMGLTCQLTSGGGVGVSKWGSQMKGTWSKYSKPLAKTHDVLEAVKGWGSVTELGTFIVDAEALDAFLAKGA